MKSYYVYILKCADKSFYTGITNDLERRISEHQSGLNLTCFTYTRRPIELVYKEVFTNPTIAIIFEKKIKKWSRAKKQALIEGRFADLPKLSRNKQNEKE